MDAARSPKPSAPGTARSTRSPRIVVGIGMVGWIVAAGLAVPHLTDPGAPTTSALAEARDVAVADADRQDEPLSTTTSSLPPTTTTSTSADAGAGAETDDAADHDPGVTSAWEDDPFAGMTDAEVDALSDDDFFARLDEAGWTIDDDGWIVPADDATGTDTGTIDDHDHHEHAEVGDETAATFTVDGDRLTRVSGDPGALVEAERIWTRFVELIPAGQRTMLTGFELMAESGGGGYVYPDEHDPTKWVMGISTDLGGDEDYVLIHEFAHLLTLQADEVPPGFDTGGCVTFHTGEGCSLSGSTIAEFVDRFWPDDMVDEIRSIEETGDWDAGWDFYERHADQFVTDYAATNPAEDLAETFTVFVLNDRPTGDSIADQKVQFLWNDPALVELRNQIRAAI